MDNATAVSERCRESRLPSETPQGRLSPVQLGENAWWLYLAAMLALTAAYVLAHFTGPHWLNSGPVYNLIGGSTVVAIVMGTRRNSPSHRLPWYLLAVGLGLFLTSNILSYNYEKLFGSALPMPSVADPFHLAFYLFFVAAMLLLIHERSEIRERAGMIDALIVTGALATLLWVYLIAPYVDKEGLSLLHRLTSTAYPAMDIVVLGVVARVAAGSKRREPAFGFLLAGAVVLLFSDGLYGWKQLDGGYNIAGVMASGWAIFFALVGTAALHPSMRLLSQPGPEPDVRLTRARLALLSCAGLTAPLVMIVRLALNEPLNLYVVIGASVAMFALVLARMAGIVRSNEEATDREEALRMAGEALVTASSREDIYVAALDAARSVVEEQVHAAIYVWDAEGGALRPLEGSQEQPPGVFPLRREELPEQLTRGRLASRVLCIERPGARAYVAPLLVGGELTAVLAVFSPGRLKRAAQESLGTLASEVALALQSAALTEESLQRRSESRLSALIKNASDVVCIVSLDGIVQYMSPSVERMFGHHPEDLLERDLNELVVADERVRLHGFIAAIAAQPPAQPTTAEFHVQDASGRILRRRGSRDEPARGRADRGDRAEREGHQRAEVLRGRARAPGLPRHAHRPPEPRAAAQPRGARARRAAP